MVALLYTLRAVALWGLLFGYLLTIPPASAQPFVYRTITKATTGVRAVAVADVNGDGAPDLLSASVFANRIAWHNNEGVLSTPFATHGIAPALSGSHLLQAADLDGDDDVDLISASRSGNAVTWYENDGAPHPQFRPHVLPSPGPSPGCMVTADVNGDGRVDLLVGVPYDDTIWWYENKGGRSASFVRHPVSASAPFVRALRAADIDGDGDTDVVAATGDFNRTVRWYEHDGTSRPHFTEHVIPTAANHVRTLAIADLDADGALDVLTVSFVHDTITWHQSDGAPIPTFTSHVLADEAEAVTGLWTADVDGDGRTDVLSTSAFDPGIAWYQNNGTDPPRFTRRTIHATGAVDALAVVDLDADGDTDIVSASAAHAGLAWHENRADVILSMTTPFPSEFGAPGEFHTEDVWPLSVHGSPTAFLRGLEGATRERVPPGAFRPSGWKQTLAFLQRITSAGSELRRPPGMHLRRRTPATE